MLCRRAVGAMATSLALVSACAEHRGRGPSDDGGGSTDPLGDTSLRDSDALGADAGAAPTAGAVTHVSTRKELVADRLCDLDGDGELDNAVADLGSTAASMTLIALNSLMDPPGAPGAQIVMHLPRVDDLRGRNDESTTVLMLLAERVDLERDELRVLAPSVDACGEPQHYFEDARLENGELETPSEGTLAVRMEGFVLVGRGAHLRGSLSSDSSAGEWLACARLPARDIGDDAVPIIEAGDLSFLELLLAGGAGFGMPTVPGLTPDLDLDGDGLERFVLDDALRIATCIDGDRTTIEGRDCWRDPRIADAFSVNVGFETAPATLLGLEPGWEELVEGECATPPEESLWDAR